MIYGELGRFPLEIRVKLRMIAFWSKLVLNENKLSSVLYRLMYLLKTKHQYSFKWLNHIESIFNSTGMGFIFTNQFPVYDKSVFNQILRDQFVQKWLSDIYSSSRGQIYSVFKKDFCIENYLLRLSEHSRIWITKFRTSNLHLPIETGRWYNIPREERICHLCKETIYRLSLSVPDEVYSRNTSCALNQISTILLIFFYYMYPETCFSYLSIHNIC
jgi:hypothetical protein